MKLRALTMLAMLLTACFDPKLDLATCRDAGRCAGSGGGGGTTGGGSGGGDVGGGGGESVGGGGGSGGGAGPGLSGLGSCMREGVCWEAPLPSSLPLTSVAATGPDDWWFTATSGLLFHRLDGGWSMERAGTPPNGPDEYWLDTRSVVACKGQPWVIVPTRGNGDIEQVWTLGGSGFEAQRDNQSPRDPQDPTFFNYGKTSASWSTPDGGCAWAGSSFQSVARPWVALGADDGPQPWWQEPELTGIGREITALGGTSLEDVWLSISTSALDPAAMYQRDVDGGFARRFALPPGSTRVSSLCVRPSGEVLVAGTGGFARADPDGGAVFSAIPPTGLACLPSGDFVMSLQTGVKICADAGACGADLWPGRGVSALGQYLDKVVAISDAGEVLQVTPTVQPWSSGSRAVLNDVWIDADGGGYAVGSGSMTSRFVLLERTSGGWVPHPVGAIRDAARVVRGLGDGRLMVLGDSFGVFVDRDGGLTDIRVRTQDGGPVSGFPIEAYAAAQAPDGTWWAVGRSPLGTALRLVGNEFREAPISGAINTILLDLAFTADGQGWAAGFDGQIWRSNDGGWALEWTTTGGDYFRTVLAASGAVWAAGTHGLGARFEDGGWTRHDFPDNQDDIALLYEGPDTLHAVGWAHRYSLDADGVTWVAEPGLPVIGAGNLHRGFVAGNRGWIVGEQGAILSFPR